MRKNKGDTCNVARKAPGQGELLKKNAKGMRYSNRAEGTARWRAYTWRVVGIVRRSVAFLRQTLPRAPLPGLVPVGLGGRERRGLVEDREGRGLWAGDVLLESGRASGFCMGLRLDLGGLFYSANPVPNRQAYTSARGKRKIMKIILRFRVTPHVCTVYKFMPRIS